MKILALSPYNLPVRGRLAQMQLQQGRTAEGVAEYFRLGAGYERHQKDAEANAVYRLILEHSPGHPEASRRLGLPVSETEAVQRDDVPVNGDLSPSSPQAVEDVDRQDTDAAVADSPQQYQTPADMVPEVDVILLDDEKVVEPFAIEEDSSRGSNADQQEPLPVNQSDYAGVLPAEFQDHLEIQYELALAYKEMGLLDEAIETFEQAIRSPSRWCTASRLIAAARIDRNSSSPRTTSP